MSNSVKSIGNERELSILPLFIGYCIGSYRAPLKMNFRSTRDNLSKKSSKKGKNICENAKNKC